MEVPAGPPPEELLPDIERAVAVLGGRVSDLEALVVRYKSGKSLTGKRNREEVLPDLERGVAVLGDVVFRRTG